MPTGNADGIRVFVHESSAPWDEGDCQTSKVPLARTEIEGLRQQLSTHVMEETGRERNLQVSGNLH